MTICFVRHGKGEDGFRGGWSQRGLIEEGIQQSKKLGGYLKDYHNGFKINRIISSDLKRAWETSKYIGDSLQLPVEPSKEWRETNDGVLAGLPNDEVNKKFTGLYFNRLRMDERYPKGESPIENFNRLKMVLEGICKEQAERNHHENVLIVTHGGVINIIYHILKREEWTNKNKSFPASNTSIHKVEFLNDSWVFTKENLIEHLYLS